MENTPKDSTASKSDLANYEQDPAFHEFIDREFDLMAAQAPLEDLAIFAFGGIQQAIAAFEEHKRALGDAATRA